jgi:hypothetical protein
MFGDFEAARAQLAAIDWQSRPPMFQGAAAGAEAVVAMLERADFAAALELTERAAGLCAIHGTVPFAGRARKRIALFHDAVRALANDDREAAARVEMQLSGWSLSSPKPILVWALSVAYRRWGKHDRAAELRARLDALAPHAVGLWKDPPEAPEVLDVGEVASAIDRPAEAGRLAGTPQARFGEPIQLGKAGSRLKGTVLLWALLILLFYVIYTIVSAGGQDG